MLAVGLDSVVAKRRKRRRAQGRGEWGLGAAGERDGLWILANASLWTRPKDVHGLTFVSLVVRAPSAASSSRASTAEAKSSDALRQLDSRARLDT